MKPRTQEETIQILIGNLNRQIAENNALYKRIGIMDKELGRLRLLVLACKGWTWAHRRISSKRYTRMLEEEAR